MQVRGSTIRNCEDNSRTLAAFLMTHWLIFCVYSPWTTCCPSGEPRESHWTRNRFFQRTIKIHVHTTWYPNTSMPPCLLASPCPLPHWDMHFIPFYLEPKPKAQSSACTAYRVVEVIVVELKLHKTPKAQKHKNNVVPSSLRRFLSLCLLNDVEGRRNRTEQNSGEQI